MYKLKNYVFFVSGDTIIFISEQILQFSISKVVTGSEFNSLCFIWSKMKTNFYVYNVYHIIILAYKTIHFRKFMIFFKIKFEQRDESRMLRLFKLPNF